MKNFLMVGSVRNWSLLLTGMAILCVLIPGVINAQQEGNGDGDSVTVTEASFGTTPQGQEVIRYVLENGQGMSVGILDFGGHIQFVKVPDRKGNIADVALGYDKIADYIEHDGNQMGATVGRYANRIANGRFTLNGEVYTLSQNNMDNHLHGVFSSMPWKGEIIETEEGAGVSLSRISPDGEGGFPGNLDVTVRFILTPNNHLNMEFITKTDKATPVNLTNHTYFNLKGHGEGTILDHVAHFTANTYTPTDSELIPTGEIKSVVDTPLNFSDEPKKIGKDIQSFPKDPFGEGYDHNYALGNHGTTIAVAARIYEPESGRVLEILTTKPGFQFYTGNWLNSDGKDGKPYRQYSGFAIEPQYFPDAPNKGNFPSPILEPGEERIEKIVFRFSTQSE